MTLFERFLYKLRGRKHAFPNTKHIIKYAFTSGGIDYFQMDDLFNMPYQRAMEAIHVYEELQMKCDKAYLIEHSKLIDEILTGQRIGMGEMMKLKSINDQLRQRLDWVVLPDHAYKLASIVYFDASESPINYEISYGLKKIKHWKEHDDVQGFFLRQPVKTLMPFLNGFDGNFKEYSAIVDKVNLSHLRNLSTKFSEMPESEITVKQ